MMYEAFITIESVPGISAFRTFDEICKRWRFLPDYDLMDSRAIGKSDGYGNLWNRLQSLRTDLSAAGFRVRGMKIVSILFDEDCRSELLSDEPRVSAACSSLNGG